MIFILNKHTDPYFNLAAEEYLLKTLKKEVFMLWRNDKAVIVGKNQNTISEIDINYVKEDDIKVVRRITGGGAVFHDLGNINYTYIEKESEGHFNDYQHFTKGLITFLASLNVQAEQTGRNDIVIQEKKICGNAQCVSGDLVMHHGCILYSADLSLLTNALKSKEEKYQGRAIKSIVSRVTNIIEYLPFDKISSEEFMIAFGNFMTENNNYDKYELTQEDIEAIEKLVNEKYSTWDWNYGSSPKYTYTNIKKFDFGLVEVSLSTTDGLISGIKIAGDFFGRMDVIELEKLLLGCRHDKEELLEVLNDVEVDNYIVGCQKEQLLDVIL